MVKKGPIFRESVIWSFETTVRQRPQGKDIEIRVHSSVKKEDLPVNPQVHSGGFSVMFLGCFSKVGLGPLVVLEGNMTGEKYIKLLQDSLIPELQAANRPMTFMQDNAPCHRKSCQGFYGPKRHRSAALASSISRYEPNRKLMGNYQEKETEKIWASQDQSGVDYANLNIHVFFCCIHR
jgi:hypothetical protein